MLPSSRWLLFLFAVCIVATPTLAQGTSPPTIFHKLYESVFGKQVAVVLDIPDCLIDLKGGAEIEETLAKGVQDGQKWAILVSTAGDRTSVVAIEKFYTAVNEICSPSTPTAATIDRPESSTQDIFDSNDKSEKKQHDFSDWKFAYMSFESEPHLIWKWWIWKVPSIVFVSSPTQDIMPYDMRFWKIAFDLPNTERIKDVIGYGYWENINPWKSSLAPGGSLELVPWTLGKVFGLFYKALDPVPTWLLTVLASVLGSTLISKLHSSGGGSAA